MHKHAKEDVLDISPTGIHKWHALKTLGIEAGTYVAFGNDANDITMFEHAHHTVMIGHHDQLAHVAKEAISNDGNVEQKIIKKIQEI